VIALEPNHLQANFNLGIFYWQGRRDFAAAATQFNKVVELTKNDTSDTAHAINQQSIARLADVYADAEAAGQPLDPGGTF
jgi:lipoprotein NlpI